MDWRPATWVPRLGWTGLFALIAYVCGQVYQQLVLEGSRWAVYLAFHVPPLAAAFLIGTRFRSWWWAVVAPVVMFLAGFQLLIPPAVMEVVWEHVPRSMFKGLSGPEAMALSGFFWLFLLLGQLVLYALVAALGVRRWDQRRQDEAAFHGDGWSGDDARIGQG